MTATKQKTTPGLSVLKKTVSAVQEESKEQGKKIDALVDAVSTLADAVNNQSMAKNHPVATNKYTESEEQSLGAEGSAEFADHDGDQALDRPVEIETEVFTTEKLKDLAFYEEFLTVQIQEVSDKDADKVFEIEVNGEKEFFRRGEQKKVRRKFVEGLARAKPINYGSEEYLGNDGLKHVRYPSSKGLRYPFALVNPRPIDTSWLQAILAQP